MNNRKYYSVRTGKNPLASQWDLPILLRSFKDLYVQFLAKDYFQQAFGFTCVDMGDVSGTLGLDIEAQMFRKLRKPGLWPIQDKCTEYSEDDLFDVIEFLYDFISKPVDGNYHSWNDCGWHYETFDGNSGREEYRAEINEFLGDYKEGYELSIAGEILALPEKGLENLWINQLENA